jgi:hypothetical protein
MLVFTLLAALAIVNLVQVVPALSQTAPSEPAPVPADLGNISGAVVTLYYYDPATGEKGERVEMPDNPQYVQWDEQAAAPGTYTFTRVPEGTYYIEAVHGNNSWFAIATVYRGTTTANVAIPPKNWTLDPTTAPSTTVIVTPSPSATPVQATATPRPSPTSTPAPGMEAAAALAGIAIISFYLARKK